MASNEWECEASLGSENLVTWERERVGREISSKKNSKTQRDFPKQDGAEKGRLNVPTRAWWQKLPLRVLNRSISQNKEPHGSLEVRHGS